MKDIEFCVIYVLLNLFNFNLIKFRYYKNKKKQWKKISAGDGDSEEFFPRNGEWGGDGGRGSERGRDDPPHCHLYVQLLKCKT